MIPMTSKTMDRTNFPNPFIGAYPLASHSFYTTLVIDSNTLPCYPLAERLEGTADGRMGKRTDDEGSKRHGI